MQSQTQAINSPSAFAVTIGTASPMRQVASWYSLAHRVLGVVRQRRRLAAMTNRELADVGISRDQALAEAARPFWDLPRNQISLNT